MIEIYKDGLQRLTNLTNEEKTKIKTELTLPNPAYEQAKKFSRFSYTSVPPYLTYYISVDDGLIVPRGYTVPFKSKVVVDNRVEVKVPYPQFKFKLRVSQREAFEEWNDTREKGMFILQTGKGKTVEGIFLSYIARQKTLIVVNKNDLVDGWTEDIKNCLGITKSEIGLIKAERFFIGTQYTIATIQSLNRMDAKKLRSLYDTFGMVIVDEVHHITATSYELLKFFRARYFIGFTATDMKKNGLTSVIYWMIGEVCYRGKEEENDEDIMPYEVIIKSSKISYDPPQEYFYGNSIVDEDTAQQLRMAGKYVKRKPLDTQELRQLVRDKDFNELVAKDIVKEYNARKSCIVFIHEKEHIRDMETLLIQKGVPKGQIQLYYGDSNEEDSVMKKRAESKEVLITIATYAKATEGTNVKAWERGFLVTSMNDIKNTIQAVGRCRRRKDGKEDVIIYDYTHPLAKGLSGHIETRLKAYKMHHAKITWIGATASSKHSKGVISRGWNK
jgi:superfamily II DNA or RNA helicase